MSVSRREFIRNGLGFVSLGVTMPTILMRAAEAAAAEAPSSDGAVKGKILVVIEMAGGNDGLNTVIPFTDPEYAKARPKIGLAKDEVVPIGATLALHPRLKPLAEFFEKGHCGVVTGVGYPNPNRSHFYSMDIWQMGDTGTSIHERSGWLARYLDADGHFNGNALGGMVVGASLPLALRGPHDPATVASENGNSGFGAVGGGRKDEMAALQTLYTSGTVAQGSDDFVRKVGADIYTSSEAIRAALQRYDEKAGRAANYPAQNGLARRLQTIAKLINGGLPTRVYYATIGGFDTHANQPTAQANVLGALAEALAAFQRDLTLQGRAGDVVTMTFSEFGRRVQENGSQGTDHGAASVLFTLGEGVRGGVHGAYPSLTDLDNGDLRFTTDFRRVYATLLDKWLRVAPAKVLNGTFDPLAFL
jgi:uncharacterized protein (DUF1501 family)